MAYVVRGVQLFSGLSAPDEWGEGPLRRVDRLCGLLLGEQDTFDFDEFGGQEPSQLGQQGKGLRLVSIDGLLVDGEDRAIDDLCPLKPLPAQKANF